MADNRLYIGHRKIKCCICIGKDYKCAFAVGLHDGVTKFIEESTWGEGFGGKKTGLFFFTEGDNEFNDYIDLSYVPSENEFYRISDHGKQREVIDVSDLAWRADTDDDEESEDSFIQGNGLKELLANNQVKALRQVVKNPDGTYREITIEDMK